MGNSYICCVGMYLHNAQAAHITLPHTCINMIQHAFSKHPERTTAQYFHTANRTDTSEYTAMTEKNICGQLNHRILHLTNCDLSLSDHLKYS